jgi:hypothetical protein
MAARKRGLYALDMGKGYAAIQRPKAALQRLAKDIANFILCVVSMLPPEGVSLQVSLAIMHGSMSQYGQRENKLWRTEEERGKVGESPRSRPKTSMISGG